MILMIYILFAAQGLYAMNKEQIPQQDQVEMPFIKPILQKSQGLKELCTHTAEKTNYSPILGRHTDKIIDSEKDRRIRKVILPMTIFGIIWLVVSIDTTVKNAN